MKFIKKRFEKILIICGNSYSWQKTFHEADFISDDEILKFPREDYDLVIHGMSLHYSNDPIGQLIQCRSFMEKGGLLLGIFLGGQTLNELRAAIASAEIELTGGISPRVLPMIDIRDAGSFLMRAGFSLPVADISVNEIDYKKPFNKYLKPLVFLNEQCCSISDSISCGICKFISSPSKSALYGLQTLIFNPVSYTHLTLPTKA